MTTQKNLETKLGVPALALVGVLGAGETPHAGPVDFLTAVYDSNTGDALIDAEDMPHIPAYRLVIIPREDVASYILGFNSEEFPGALVANNPGNVSQVLDFDYDLGQYLPFDIPSTGLTINLGDNFPNHLIDNNVPVLDLISYDSEINQGINNPPILPVNIVYSQTGGGNSQVPTPGTLYLVGAGLFGFGAGLFGLGALGSAYSRRREE